MSQKMTSAIVGSSFYKGAGEIIMRLQTGAPLTLKREPDNKFDKNAISVWYIREPKFNQQLGHLPRGLAELLAPKLDAGLIVSCRKSSVPGAHCTLEWELQDGQASEPPAETGDQWLSRFKGLIE